jgi:hypothetical protein
MGHADSLRSAMSKRERESFRPAHSRALRHLHANHEQLNCIGDQKSPPKRALFVA